MDRWKCLADRFFGGSVRQFRHVGDHRLFDHRAPAASHSRNRSQRNIIGDHFGSQRLRMVFSPGPAVTQQP